MINWLKGQWDKETALIALGAYGIFTLVVMAVL